MQVTKKHGNCVFFLFFFFFYLIPKREPTKIFHSPNAISGYTTGFPFFKYLLTMNSKHWLRTVKKFQRFVYGELENHQPALWNVVSWAPSASLSSIQCSMFWRAFLQMPRTLVWVSSLRTFLSYPYLWATTKMKSVPRNICFWTDSFLNVWTLYWIFFWGGLFNWLRMYVWNKLNLKQRLFSAMYFHLIFVDRFTVYHSNTIIIISFIKNEKVLIVSDWINILSEILGQAKKI